MVDSGGVCPPEAFLSVQESDDPSDCIDCFCMGVPQSDGSRTECHGSNLFRTEERAIFADDETLDFALTDAYREEVLAGDGDRLRVDSDAEELVVSDFQTLNGNVSRLLSQPHSISMTISP